jgi:hypothetical protein
MTWPSWPCVSCHRPGMLKCYSANPTFFRSKIQDYPEDTNVTSPFRMQPSHFREVLHYHNKPPVIILYVDPPNIHKSCGDISHFECEKSTHLFGGPPILVSGNKGHLKWLRLSYLSRRYESCQSELFPAAPSSRH